MAYNDVQETEEQLIARFVGGLGMTIHNEVEMHRLWSLNDAYQLALKVEAKLARSSAKKFMKVWSLRLLT